MASGIFAVLDDIAALMDDVAIATKVATKKTAAILGDDLAVNAEKATGFVSSRELPVLWAITKGSLINKIIIVPLAILLSIYLPVAIKVILFLGGCFLAFEGVEKIIEYFFHKKNKTVIDLEEASTEPSTESNEKAKVKSAITTDFILSVEIVILALNSVINEPLKVKIITVAIVALLATIGVYGLVALIVRMDDAGYKLISQSKGKGIGNTIGIGLVKGLPLIVKALTIIGTVALILVSGGIFVHTFEYLHHHFLPNFPEMLRDAILGLGAGIIVVLLVKLAQMILGKKGH